MILTDPPRPEGSPSGDDLRAPFESLGDRLADSLSRVVASVPGRPQGPQSLGRALGLTTVTASRLLKALSQSDPIAVLQSLPGPNPLRKMVEAARVEGCDEAACGSAMEAIEAFDTLIRTEAGDRGALKAMLSAWLPEDRREFEAQRRQTIYKALAELEGVSCDMEVVTTIVTRAANKEGWLDIVSVRSLLGIDRIRPDAVVRLGTTRIKCHEGEPDRMPLSLDGRPTLRDHDAVRLDEFCSTEPAPFVTHRYGDHVQYALGPTGFGRRSTVDVVIAEANRGEIEETQPSESRSPYYFTIPEMPLRRTAFDLIVHEDVYAGVDPELVVHDASIVGPAQPYDDKRALDRRWFPEPIQHLGKGTERARLLEFPRYLGLLDHVAKEMTYDFTNYRTYRVSVSYPLVGQQITFAFQG